MNVFDLIRVHFDLDVQWKTAVVGRGVVENDICQNTGARAGNGVQRFIVRPESTRNYGILKVHKYRDNGTNCFISTAILSVESNGRIAACAVHCQRLQVHLGIAVVLHGRFFLHTSDGIRIVGEPDTLPVT